MAAESPYAPVRIDPGEILEARWAPAEHPPEPLGEHARAVLGLAEDSGT
jgi:hypothetical protein